jgi:putative ABC transport system ATP-binding protein
VKRPAAITLDSVSKHYATPAGPVQALSDVAFELEAGGSLAISGPSGCGKSTLLSLIGGLETPSSGRVNVGGEEIATLPEALRARLRRNDFGFVFQRDNLLPFLTGLENVALQLALRATSEAYEHCVQVLAEIGLADRIDKLPDQLSGGERQRVAVARALIGRPAVILADEPTGSLDAGNSAAVMDLLLTAQRQSATTLVVVTHDPEVARLLDETLSLRDGQLTKDGAASELAPAPPPT